MKKSHIAIHVLSIFCFFILSACSSSSSGTASIQTGTLSVGLTDATTTDYQAVYITVKEVKVSKSLESEDAAETDTSWVMVAEPNATYNLLELINGVIQQLGLSDLEAGQYNQMRLVLGTQQDNSLNIKGESHPFPNYIIYGIDEDVYEYFELVVPSGFQSGLKIVSGFTVDGNETTNIVLDFNVLKSIVQAGADGKWLLKPTVKAFSQEESSSIHGIVYTQTDDGDLPLEGAIVSAQTTTEGAENQIVTASSTVTNELGEYVLLANAGKYQVVAVMPQYQTAMAEVIVSTNSTAEQDFNMTSAEGIGTIYGDVTILNAAENQSVTINILEKQDDDSVVEVASTSVANGGTYYFDLPPGVYSMVAIFTVNDEEMTLEANEAFEIINGTVIEFDILFENVEDEDNKTAGDDDSSDTETPEKVTICHKGRTITISSSALQAHLNHGDTEGACGDTIDDDDADTGKQQKVTICHKGRQITVSESSLQAHLKHGDTIGECGGEQDNDEDDE